MCGRFGFDIPPARVAEHFGLASPPEAPARWNIAPTQPVGAVLAHPGGGRVWRVLRWGLVPPWAKDVRGAARMINARAETAAEKPAFRQALARRRCIVPASLFYEWRRPAHGPKEPHAIALADGAPLGLAALWEHWRGSESAQGLFTCAILTTRSNDLMATLHDRMPVILPPASYEAWLAPDAGPPKGFDAPYPAGAMRAWPVSSRVNSVANDGPDLAAPIPGQSQLPLG